MIYIGQKEVQGIKFQSLVTLNSPIAHMYGPVEEKRHDVRMLTMSKLLPKLQQYARDTQGRRLCIYGDPAYQIYMNFQAPFRNIPLTADQKAYNKAMNQVRVISRMALR